MYDARFDGDVRRLVGECDEKEDGLVNSTVRAANNFILSGDKMKLTTKDLFDIVEYTKLRNKEGIDHDTLQCTEMAIVFEDNSLSTKSQYIFNKTLSCGL